MLKNEREKFFLSIIIIVIFSGFLIWHGIVSVKADIEKNISEVKNKKVFSKVYDLKKESLPLENNEYDFSKKAIEKINDYFVYADDNDNVAFTSFFTELEELAFQSTKKRNSLSVELYQREVAVPKGKKAIGSAPAVPTSDSRLLKLTLQGNFENLSNFVSYLEAMPYYIYIESMNINIANSAEIKKNLDINGTQNNSTNLQAALIIKIFRKTNEL